MVLNKVEDWEIEGNMKYIWELNFSDWFLEVVSFHCQIYYFSKQDTNVQSASANCSQNSFNLPINNLAIN